MAVEFEFQVTKGFNLLNAFGSRFNTIVEHDRVYLPEMLGDGYIQQLSLDGINLFLHNYKLKQEFTLKRQPALTDSSLTLKFARSSFVLTHNQQNDDPFFDQVKKFEIELATCNFTSALTLKPDVQINLIVIGISRENLLNLLQAEGDNLSVLEMIKNQPSFLIRDVITPEMDYILKQVFQINASTDIALLLYKIKALELIYNFFRNLINRPINRPLKISKNDAEKIYLVRIAMLKDLTKCPQLSELAKISGLGTTKLKRLFNQIYGASIYNYFQNCRMKEATNLLISLSVTETGNKLGFTNLSHFTRLFEKHYHIKPKQFKYRMIWEPNIQLIPLSEKSD